MRTCCDELAWARTVNIIADGNLGPSLRVHLPEEGNRRFVPMKHCPFCGTEADRNSPTPPVIAYLSP